MLENNIDTIVLGCTHYPFVIPLIERIIGDKARVIDPAPAVARQVRRLLEAGGSMNPATSSGSIRMFTTGDPEMLKSMLPKLLGEDAAVEKVEWSGETRLIFH